MQKYCERYSAYLKNGVPYVTIADDIADQEYDEALTEIEIFSNSEIQQIRDINLEYITRCASQLPR